MFPALALILDLFDLEAGRCTEQHWYSAEYSYLSSFGDRAVAEDASPVSSDVRRVKWGTRRWRIEEGLRPYRKRRDERNMVEVILIGSILYSAESKSSGGE